MNTLWLKYDNWMKGHYPDQETDLSAVTVDVGIAQTAKIAADNYRPFFHNQAPTNIPTPHSTAT